jgi:predicted O-methyltransferase YrrM
MSQARTTMSKLVNYGRRLLQPRYWPELRRLAIRKVKGVKWDTEAEAEARARCSAHAVDAETAFAKIGLPTSAMTSFAEDFPDRLAEARARVEAARGRMGGGADVDLLYSLSRATQATSVLETGVAFGWSSLAILSAINDRPGAKLVSVDLPYLSVNMDNQVGLAISADLKQFWSLHRGADREQLPNALAEIGTIDLAHYDSDKSYGGRQWAYSLIWSALKPNGLLVSDDIQDNVAFHDFARERGLDPIIVAAAHEDKFIGILRKTA